MLSIRKLAPTIGNNFAVQPDGIKINNADDLKLGNMKDSTLFNVCDTIKGFIIY